MPAHSSRRSLHQQLDSASSPAATGPAPSPGGPAPPHLAGIDKPLSALSAHVVHSLSARALGTGGASAGAIPGVLVTGASGAGKTALVKEAARRMAKDERALCRASAFLISLPCDRGPDGQRTGSPSRHDLRRLRAARRRTASCAQRPVQGLARRGVLACAERPRARQPGPAYRRGGRGALACLAASSPARLCTGT